MTILDNIIEQKRREIMDGKYDTTGERAPVPSYSFYNTLRHPKRNLAIIAEVKKASPSKGVFVDDFDPVRIAKTYETLQVDCISVLTDEVYFQGHSSFITEIKKSVSKPLLRKDFIIDEIQIYHSAEIGADAILLIASILEKNQLREYMDLAEELHLDVLMEVHDESDIEKVLSVSKPKIIGVNNRDLRTFQTTLETTGKLSKFLPDESLFISESGIKSRADIDYLLQHRVDGILVGEAFMVEKNKEAVLNKWFS